MARTCEANKRISRRDFNERSPAASGTGILYESRPSGTVGTLQKF